jgi:hydrogenase-4 component E
MSMVTLSNLLVILLVLTNFLLLGSSRLALCIRMVAYQALFLGLFPLLAQWGVLTWEVVLIAAVSTLLKAVVMPGLLRRSMRVAGILREVEPLVGFSLSLVIGVALLGASVYLGSRLTLPVRLSSPFFVPVSLFTLLTGLFMVVSRKKALTQVIGYLAMENGIYAFGLAFAVHAPLLVELGTLLDIFAAVFVMGIAIYHIRREFDHLDTDRLTVLKE